MVELVNHVKSGEAWWLPSIWDLDERIIDDMPRPGQYVLARTNFVRRKIGLVVACDGIRECWVLWSLRDV